ncbi:uncharacterized protein LOC110598835 [Ictidomys tridecemlineatus]
MVTRVRLHPGGFWLLLPSATPVISPGVEHKRSQVALGALAEGAKGSPIHPAAPWSIDSNRFCLRELTRGEGGLCATPAGAGLRAPWQTHLRGRDPAPPTHTAKDRRAAVVSRWGKGTRAAATLTRQRLLLRRRQQSRRTPAPSSATASSSAAATNRPFGTANRHNRRCPGRPPARPPPRPRTTGRREGSGRKRTQSGPSALVRGPGISGTAASQSRGARRTPKQCRGLGRAADTAAAGFVIVDSDSSSAEHAGKRPAAGEGRTGRRRLSFAQDRKSVGCRERGGSASGGVGLAWQLGCPALTWEDFAGVC